MYPYELFWGLHLYDLLFVIGVFCALLYFRFFADRRKMSAGLQNLVIVSVLGAVIGGYASAVLFQAFYNYLESGVFEIVNNTGATFYGGLIGGVLVFAGIYFLGSATVLRRERLAPRFWEVSELCAGGIALAHGLGRIGCLCAGCCHGKPTDAWYGIYNAGLGVKTVPVQLFEALFLFALAAFLTYRLVKHARGNLGVYLCIYAVWRFFIEYLRTDERGSSFIPFLSPSQLTAICLFAVGVAFFFIARKGGEANDRA